MSDKTHSSPQQDVVRILSIDLTDDQRSKLEVAVGTKACKRIHIDEVSGGVARMIHPSLISARLVVASW